MKNKIKDSKKIGEILYHYNIKLGLDDTIIINNLYPYCFKHNIKMLKDKATQIYSCTVRDCSSKIDHNPDLKDKRLLIKIKEKIIQNLNKKLEHYRSRLF